MRRIGWPILGIALAATLAGLLYGASAALRPRVETFGKGPAYRRLAGLPVLHHGRVKPIDTLAREEVKQIHGRERITLLGPDDTPVASWEPAAAVLDWGVRPEFWNEQPLIKVEYLPLKRALLAGSSREILAEIAARSTTGAADRAALTRVAGLDEVAAADLKPIVAANDLPAEDKLAVARLMSKLGEAHKWLSADELNAATVLVGGRAVPFSEWVDSITERRRAASESGEETKLSTLERRGFEAGSALAAYRDLRDHGLSSFVPLMVMPRPYNATALAASGQALQKAQAGPRREMTDLDLESAFVLKKYLEDVPQADWRLPGADKLFDEKYAAWLRDNSQWVPLTILLKTPINDLAQAGYPSSKVEAFRSAFLAFEAAERDAPGRIGLAPADALVDAARDLGDVLNEVSYPEPKAIGRELLFNTSGPFFFAPFAYGMAVVLLGLSLTVDSYRTPVVAGVRRVLYLSGIASFLAGIGLEVFGFSLRVMISGWAPVTNMYETVVWVALVTSVIGLVLEAIYRRTYAALAASGVAAVCTALATTAPFLDSTIQGLQPVLRSNLWLTIHVLTIVSSYAAFALAMGLGLIATGYYLTATYRRSASWAELGLPLLPGLPLLASGIIAILGSYDTIHLGPWFVAHAFYPSVVVIAIGGVLTATGLVALSGEALDRAIHRPGGSIDPDHPEGLRSVDVRELVAAGGPLPPVSGGGPLGEDDARAVAMRETATRIKPLSNFIYRAMQVGVLLVAAGTILGGVWADYSWGRFWGWDPKEVWALITLLVYLVPLHGRFAGWVNTFGLVVASVVCFLSVLMAWYGVNSIIGVGLHAYGFMEDGSQGTVGIATLATLSLPAGTAWRRFLSQRLI